MTEKDTKCGERHPFQPWTCALFKGHVEPYHSQSRDKRWRAIPTDESEV